MQYILDAIFFFFIELRISRGNSLLRAPPHLGYAQTIIFPLVLWVLKENAAPPDEGNNEMSLA